MLHEACVCKRDATICVRIRLWLLRRDDRSGVLVGASGAWRCDWSRRDVGALIGRGRLSAFGISARSDGKYARMC